MLNLALPDIAVSLHASTGDLQWFSDAYSLVIAALILPAGLLGDRYGRKRVLLVAVVLFVGYEFYQYRAGTPAAVPLAPASSTCACA